MKLSEGSREASAVICACYLAKGFQSYNNFTGLIVAGYGKEDVDPGVYEIHIRPKWEDKLRVQVTRYYSPKLHSFAQDEQIQNLVNSLSIKQTVQLRETAYLELLKLAPLIAEGTKGIGTEIEERMTETMSGLAWSFAEDVVEGLYGSPPITISHLMRLSPLDMADFAEKLVHIEATIQYVTQATGAGVGGPVDVVSITKEDGLVWIKRKNKIDEQLNPRIHKIPRPEARNI